MNRQLHRFIALIPLLLCSLIISTGKASEDQIFSDVKSDEHVTFFRTSSWLDEENSQWMIPIHGWIYEPQDSVTRKASIAKIIDQEYGLKETAETSSNFDRRVNLLLADNERNKQIVIHLAGKNYVLSISKSNGHFQTVLALERSEFSPTESKYIRFFALLNPKDKRQFNGESLLLEPDGVSVISDIDDTVKISHVTDRPKLVKATFFDDFAAVKGMSDVYRELQTAGASFHYVSSSPWQLYQPLNEFLADNKFPWASLSLKALRFRDKTILNLFKKGTETKPAAIRSILDKYPKRSFILIGDSGEQDAEVYAQIAEHYPKQIKKIFIRNIDKNAQLNEQYMEVFKRIDSNKWQTFISAAEINASVNAIKNTVAE